jgi:hypothetical protein
MTKTLAVAVGLVAAVAFAGKPERDKQKEVTAQVSEHAKTVKAACGCEVKISPKWDSYKKADDMTRIDNCAEAFATAAKQQCASPEDKKAFCDNVKELHVVYQKGDVGDPSANNKVVTAQSNDGMYNGDNQFKAIFDKF